MSNERIYYDLEGCPISEAEAKRQAAIFDSIRAGMNLDPKIGQLLIFGISGDYFKDNTFKDAERIFKDGPIDHSRKPVDEPVKGINHWPLHFDPQE